MSNQITTSFIEQYRDNVTLLSQQKTSRLRGAVMVDTDVKGKRSAEEFIGATQTQLRTTRHGDSPLVNTPHSRRWSTLYDYEWGDMVDDQDLIRTLVDPTNPYAVNAASAFGRTMDDRIITEAFADVVTGEDGDGTSAYSTTAYTGANASAAGYIDHDWNEYDTVSNEGGTGLTIAKLRALRTIFRAREIDESQPLYLACSAQQIQDLLRTDEVTSQDYNTVRALVNGDLDTFMGFKFIVLERLLTDTNGYRRCIAWARNGLKLKIGEDVKTKIEERADKSFSTYLYMRMTIGAVRREDDKVFEVKCEEPAASS